MGKIVRYNDTNNLVFAGFVASFPAVVNPKLNTADSDKEKHFYEYTIDILIPKDTDMKDFDMVVETAKSDKWGTKIPDFRYPYLKDGDKKFNKDGEIYEGYNGCWYVTVKNDENSKPRVIDLAKNELTRPDAIVGGDVVNVFCNVYAYGPIAGNAGIGFGLNTVQLKEKSENPFGGGIGKKAASDFLDQFNDLDDFTV